MARLKAKQETHRKKLTVVWLHGTEAVYPGAVYPLSHECNQFALCNVNGLLPW